MFLKISQNSQETLRQSSFLIKLQAEPCNFIKKETLIQVFSCDFAKFLRTPFLQNTSGRLPDWNQTCYQILVTTEHSFRKLTVNQVETREQKEL